MEDRMGLIKSADMPLGATTFSMQDIEAAARSMLLRARGKGDQLVAAARTESEQIKQRAKAEGLAEGRQQGRREGFEEGKKSGHAQALAQNGEAMKQTINALAQACRVFDDGRDQLHTQVINEVAGLACAIARKIVRRETAVDEGVLVRNVKEALSLTVHAADVRIAVNPAQLKTLQAELPNLKLAWPQLKHIELTEDAGISAGGARVFTAHGEIDARVEAQLEKILGEVFGDVKSSEKSPEAR
jgi:flagellar assembly protein FliH